MRLMVLLTVSILMFSSCSKTKKTYYSDGTIKSEQEYKGGELNGKSCFFLPNGELQSEYPYANGKIEGEARRYHPNGNIESIEPYHNNLKNGEAKYYNNRNALLKTVHYVNDTLHGPVKEYFPDGQLKIDGQYNKGFFDGKWIYYNEMGFQVGEGDFKSGTGIQKGFHYTGKLMREVHYQDNEKHGEEKFYNASGKLERTDIYEHGNYVKSQINDDK